MNHFQPRKLLKDTCQFMREKYFNVQIAMKSSIPKLNSKDILPRNTTDQIYTSVHSVIWPTWQNKICYLILHLFTRRKLAMFVHIVERTAWGSLIWQTISGKYMNLLEYIHINVKTAKKVSKKKLVWNPISKSSMMEQELSAQYVKNLLSINQ